MTLQYLDHVNLRTARLGAMTAFYTEVLDLRPGARPPFSFGGAWLYCGERAAIHLVEIAKPRQTQEPRIEHFAFRAERLSEFLAHLREMDVAYRISIVPGYNLRQVNIHDPDGNHIEVTFGADEEADLTDFPATRG